MLISRNGQQPKVAHTARIAESARVVGDVTLGRRCYVDHHVILESAGPPIIIGDEVVIFAGTVIRSIGGSSRPAFAVDIGTRTLVAPHCTLTGCRIGHHCYVATAAIVLQGAIIGDESRIGVGAIVHAQAVLPDRTRVGMRYIAVSGPDGLLNTADVDQARRAVGKAEFFESAFQLPETDQASLHEQVIAKLLDEVHGWNDESI